MKEHTAIESFKNEHQHGLHFCWTIQKGLQKGTDLKRMQAYAESFYINYLEDHFQFEEEMVFPILGNENELVKKAKREHRRIKRLFFDRDNLLKSLSLLEEELYSLIRFEEHELYEAVLKKATDEQLKNIQSSHQILKEEDYPDPFWEE
ncbi:hemerythrin domain-containing protein [Psychroflexus halocasei]|uniref:Hemerythrin HHE cation binding domain-containing protein n=1 Tax=Psychroflexus halocasei TaxID=908615 RepID=A0A1H4B4V0_9FLAO|nr:hemerythrin domain-containing protein [Psychroflexus halocasei]SEA43171.1 Hemerythrin HHE cation binding domain-containing protein [Psychroflexus halocasei]